MFPKRGAVALVTTVLALVLLLSFKTPDTIGTASAILDNGAAVARAGATATAGATSGATTGTTGTTSGITPSTTAAPTSAPTANPTPTASSGAQAGTQTVVGSTISTRYGDVAVEITVTGGQVTDVQAVALPTHGHSGEISNYVAPLLASEALQAQSANINVISGATYTSRAYAKSLQSALDQAGIASVAVVG